MYKARVKPCLNFETKGTLGLVSVLLQFWSLISLSLGLVHLFIFTRVSGLVSSQNIGNLGNLLRSRHVLVSVSRLKAWDSRSRPGLVPHLIIKSLFKLRCWSDCVHPQSICKEIIYFGWNTDFKIANDCEKPPMVPWYQIHDLRDRKLIISFHW